MTRGRLVVGPCPGPARPGILARNQPAAAQTKAISWGLPPCSSSRKGGPPYGWTNTGIFALGSTGRRSAGFPQLRPVSSTPVPGIEPHGGRGPLIWRFRCPAGTRDPKGTLQERQGAWDPGETPVISGIDTVAAVASWGSCHGDWSCSPGPRFHAGEFPLQTPRTGVLPFLHGKRLWNTGRLWLKRSHSLFSGSAPILQS